MPDRITADDAFDWIVTQVEACPLTSSRIGFQVMKIAPGAKLPDEKSRSFGIYVNGQGRSPWCFGAEQMNVYVKIVYQQSVNHQDLVELKNYLENHSPTKAGVSGFYVEDAFFENNDIGENKIYAYLPVAIDYKPPKLQDE